MPVVVNVEISPDEATQRLIDEGLDDYIFERVGYPDNGNDLWVIARDTGGTVQGGLKARTWYSWMFIDWLWVSLKSRGSGIGSTLLDRAEVSARERGCIGAYVDTFSFQAPDFYAKKGYLEFGRIENLPPGHACIWLKKEFV